jgi:O-antigen/teichoic acid export membrane protein
LSTRRQYIVNIIWGWISAVALIVNGMLVAPYLIRKLGTEQYGIWALGLSLVEYFWVIDLGLRPATVKLTAEYRALENWGTLNSVISTAVVYSAVVGSLLMALISLNAGFISRFLHITNPSFALLIHVVSISWAFGLVFNIFEAALEGFQRFDVTGRIFLSFVLLRSIALLTAAALGYGIRGMSIGLLSTQLLMYTVFLLALRHIYPRLRVSPRLATAKAGIEIWRYARQILSAMLSARLINSAIPALISRFLGVRSVTYYTVTQKTLDYAGDGIGRIGMITAPRAADWMARDQRPQLIRLAEYGNKYCLMLWIPVATWLWVYGDALFRLWITPEFADKASGLLPFMLLGYTFWLGQFVSASILMGVGWYSEYSISLMVEALLTTGGFVVILPRFGLTGAVAWSSLLMFSNRCVNLSRIFAGKFKVELLPFVWRSYRMPLALAVADVVGMRAVRMSWLHGGSWRELILSGVANTLILGLAAFWLVIEPEHRAGAIHAAKWRVTRLFSSR